jgi:hypothetical protein
MKSLMGVWIDHKKAVIVAAGDAIATTVQSGVRGRTRFSGGSGHPGGYISQRGNSEKRGEERHRNALDRYLDAVMAAVKGAEHLLILGPGEAKTELASRVGRARGKAPRVSTKAADKLTQAQIVAAVSAFFEPRPGARRSAPAPARARRGRSRAR